MVAMLQKAGSPTYAAEIGISLPHLMATMRAAAYIRSRYTIFDFLHETGLTEAAFAAVGPILVERSTREASA
jgi:glycerol-1-phosphate dehydrogenase [NAD(P)+]